MTALHQASVGVCHYPYGHVSLHLDLIDASSRACGAVSPSTKTEAGSGPTKIRHYAHVRAGSQELRNKKTKNLPSQLRHDFCYFLQFLNVVLQSESSDLIHFLNPLDTQL